jgi:hypothetical protein
LGKIETPARVDRFGLIAASLDWAMSKYSRAAQSSDSPMRIAWSVRELATRAAARLGHPGKVYATPEQLAGVLASGLTSRDLEVLEAHAAATQFTLAPACSEQTFVDEERVVVVHVGPAPPS